MLNVASDSLWRRQNALVLAGLVNGLLAGASLDQPIKQLPARHRIGSHANSRAADLANGVAWYAALGIGGALLTLVSSGSALLLDVPGRPRPPVVGGVLTVAHAATTARRADQLQPAVGG